MRLQLAKFVSLPLIIVSALILGTTGGLIAGMAEISTAYQEQPSEPVATTPPSSPSQPAAVSSSSGSVYTETEAKSADPPELTVTDIAQLETMLQDLGYSTTSGVLPAVKKYQEDNSLTVTGYLDLNTIYSIVNQSRINRIQQLASSITG